MTGCAPNAVPKGAHMTQSLTVSEPNSVRRKLAISSWLSGCTPRALLSMPKTTTAHSPSTAPARMAT